MNTHESSQQHLPLADVLEQIPDLNTATFFTPGNDPFHLEAEPAETMIAAYQPSSQALREGIAAVLEHLDGVIEDARSQGLTEVALLDIGGRNIKPTTILSRLGNVARIIKGDEAVIELSNPIFRELWDGIVQRGHTPVLQVGSDSSAIPGEAFNAAYRIAVRVPEIS